MQSCLMNAFIDSIYMIMNLCKCFMYPSTDLCMHKLFAYSKLDEACTNLNAETKKFSSFINKLIRKKTHMKFRYRVCGPDFYNIRIIGLVLISLINVVVSF